MTRFRTAAALAAATAFGLGLAGCNTTSQDASADTHASVATPTGEHNDTTAKGGAVSTTPGGAGATGLSTGASGGPGTPTPNNNTPPTSTTPHS